MKRSYIYTLGLGLALGSALCGCSDWDDHYDGEAAGEAGASAAQTLAENVAANPELSEFYEVLQATKVFRHHKKTAVSYADLLAAGQQLTVIAPKNGFSMTYQGRTYDKAALIALAGESAAGDSIVEKFFVGNHIARNAYSDLEGDQSLLMLNGKHDIIGGGKANGVALTATNIASKNGVLHVAATDLPYQNNIYEQIIDDYDQLGAFLKHYDEDYFDENSSVQSGMVEGVPVYVDSVIVERNRFFEAVGRLASEDSTYRVVLPSPQAWEARYNEAASNFVYPESFEKHDSVTQYWAVRSLMQNGIFSMTTTNKISPMDSLVSVQYNRSEPEFSVYYYPEAEGGILAGTQPTDCSNGTIYRATDWSMSPEQTYLRRLKIEGESTWLITDKQKCTTKTRSLVADSISKNAYVDIVPDGSTSQWTVTYRLNNVLSGTYDICAAILPLSVDGADESKLKPNKFKAEITYFDTDGSTKTYTCLNDEGKKEFKNDPMRVDTVVIARDFKFPTANYSREEFPFYLKISCSITAKENAKHSREMLLDCIYLRPKSITPQAPATTNE